MDPLIVWAGADRAELGATYAFDLDLSYGSGEEVSCDFALALPSDVRLSAGCLAFLDGTGWGGVVDGFQCDTGVRDTLTWVGRTWQGVLKGKVLRPDAGADHLVASGTTAACVSALLSRCALGGLFAVGECAPASVSYQYARYCDAWEGLLAMLASAGMRPTFVVDRSGGTVTVLVGCVSREADALESELADFAATRSWRPVNHLVCLGQGELAARTVVDLYADASGAVSTSQSLTGAAEVAQTYEQTSAQDAAELEAEGRRMLASLQVPGEVSARLREDSPLDVGDVVAARDARVDLTVTAEIGAVVVTVSRGVMSVARETTVARMVEEKR